VSERNAPTFCIIYYRSAPSAVQDEPDHKALFLHNYELYERAKKRGEPFSEFAVMALAQIHHISDVPARADHEANAQVMHDLLGPLHTEAEVREKYDQLSENCTSDPSECRQVANNFILLVRKTGNAEV
jgi:hypothetical protein